MPPKNPIAPPIAPPRPRRPCATRMVLPREQRLAALRPRGRKKRRRPTNALDVRAPPLPDANFGAAAPRSVGRLVVCRAQGGPWSGTSPTRASRARPRLGPRRPPDSRACASPVGQPPSPFALPTPALGHHGHARGERRCGGVVTCRVRQELDGDQARYLCTCNCSACGDGGATDAEPTCRYGVEIVAAMTAVRQRRAAATAASAGAAGEEATQLV